MEHRRSSVPMDIRNAGRIDKPKPAQICSQSQEFIADFHILE
jgi:hypothetical protein